MYCFAMPRWICRNSSVFLKSSRKFSQTPPCLATILKSSSNRIGNGSKSRLWSRHNMMSSLADKQLLAGLNESQVNLLSEECILIDEMDQVTGKATKMDCHLMKNINTGLLHRAFSLFLFNKNGEMLLQQRSSEKITYPNHYTNTCCSHPLSSVAELDEENAIGVKRAAQRRVKQELGIVPEQLLLDDIHYITRIHYMSANVPTDGKWGEHEIDYVLFAQCNVDLDPNRNEVQSTKYLDQKGLRELLATAEDRGILLTPWFRLIAENFLFQWWDNLHCLPTQYDHKTIYRLL